MSPYWRELKKYQNEYSKDFKKQEELVLNALSLLRNIYKLKPQMVLADAGFSTQKIIKHLIIMLMALSLKANAHIVLIKNRFQEAMEAK
jgi:hypothetical protein